MMNIQGEYDGNTLINPKPMKIPANDKVHHQELGNPHHHVKENIRKAPNRAFAHIKRKEFKKSTRTKTTINATTQLKDVMNR